MTAAPTHDRQSEKLVRAIPELEPLDEHNRALLEHVHPPDWNNPQPSGRYNLVVIGAGTAGLVTAAGAAGLGAKVALVERRLMGGDCLNVGCVPSKALIRSARAAADARRAGDFGVRMTGEIEVDFNGIMQRMRRLRANISPHDSAARFRDLGIDVFIGDAAFVDDRRVRVGDQMLQFARAVIATGGRAIAPPIEGLDDVGYLTNESVFSLTELPARLTIIGGGPIGCEMAQAFARFGSVVTLIDSGNQILSKEDPDAAQVVREAIERDGVRIVCGGNTASVERTGRSSVVHVECDETKHAVEADAILIAVGRAPNVEGLGLDSAGVEYDQRKGIVVDDRLRTTNRRIYAAGDVCSKYKFTHAADAMARIVIQNALFFGRAKVSRLVIPWCTYTDPEIAHVGMTMRDAEEQGVDVSCITIGMDQVDRAILDSDTEGMLKVLLKKGSDRILGATLVAAHAGDFLPQIVFAMTHGRGLGTIARTIHAYPTQAEVMKKAADTYNRTRLTPFVKSLFTRFLAWRR